MDPAGDIDRPAKPEIEQSWHRCRLAGLTADSLGRPSFAEPNSAGRLMVAAAPVLRELADSLDGNAFSVMLADRDCRVTYRWDGQRRLTSFLDAHGVTVGVAMDEPSYGTTAVGTVMEMGAPVVVDGTDHYLQAYSMVSCSGRPIQHPLTHRVEGVLTIVSDKPSSNPLFHPVLRRAVQDIEARIVEGCRVVEQRLFLAFQHATRHRGSPVAVVGDDVVLANRACLDLLGAGDPDVLRALLPTGVTREITGRELNLGPAGRIAVNAQPIDGTPDGVLFRLSKAPTPVPSTFAGSSFRAEHSVLIAGEPGTGRSYTAGEIAGAVRMVTIEAADALLQSEREWTNRLIDLASQRNAVVVVDDVHVLPERLCTVLHRLMDSVPSRIVLTCCSLDELPSYVGPLVGRCDRRVELLPLRERLHELPELFAAMGATRRPDREWVLTPRAIRALCAQSWEGNVLQLAKLVDLLASRPITGPIDIGELPEQYRSNPTASRLGERERAERAAIISALRRERGNKAKAAHRLGISRTTLYRRMRALKVSESAASSA